MPDAESREYGPFATEQQAWATDACAAEKAAWEANPVPGEGEKWNMRMLLDSIGELGIVLGAYDLSPLRQVAMYETSKCVALRGIIRRAFEAGKASGPDGAVTEWGFRYEGEGLPATVMPYPLAAVQQMCRESPELSPGTTRTVVARQAGPWLEAEVPASVACRHCLGPIIPCDPPHGHPACLGWKHAAWLSMGPIGAHYCEGRSVMPSGEPNEKAADA